MPKLSNDQIIGFRLRTHGLAERLAEREFSRAAGRCGIQDSPPGSALLALHARVRGVAVDTLDEALESRELLRTWCMRGAPFLVPTAEAAVFTTGVLPPTEDAARHLIQGVGPALDGLGLTLDEAVDLTARHTAAVLSGRRLAIAQLGVEVAAAIAPELGADQRERWEAEGPHAAGQPLGEAVVHFCVRVLALRGQVCFAPRDGNTAPFALTDDWLPAPIPARTPEDARAGLFRRFLRCYGPTTRADFAAWIGVRAADVDPWWDTLADQLERVDTEGARAWAHADDLTELRETSLPTGVRLLPPRDPYTQARDRAVILAPEHHRAVWKPVGEPGTVLLDGRIVGLWRPRKRSDHLTLTVTPFTPLSASDRASVSVEAEAVGALRGATSTVVAFDS
ncbi:winged helix DNA-binding domain-containing protein [Tsukamurella paurometabola]|uniref:winged helix DNA-binding domain-containing protein n=1 Tax=Tsukamurella paurometabola TaxID=2061 RepID=UPI00019EC6AB|nr:winged helix DNA-binding domain-containing protein [Tsukamurella paurometabola]